VRGATVKQPRRRASAAVGRSDATLWLAATCNFMNKIVCAQYYANKVCNVVQLLAAFVASFIADVISFLAAARRCMLHVLLQL